MLALHPEYVVDEQHHKKAVLLPLNEWQQLLDVVEKTEDVREHGTTSAAEWLKKKSSPDPFAILQELKTLLKAHFGDDIKEVILFGSQAKGTAHEDSDYDVLVVLNKKEYDWNYKKELRYVCYDIDLQYDIFTDIQIISQDEIQHSLKGCEPVYVNALQHGVYI